MHWILLFLGLAACQASDRTDPYQGYVRIADKDDVPTLDPARGYDTASWQFEDLIFETLLDYSEEGALVGELAEGWREESQGARYVFRLRGDAMFAHGRRVTAEDVRFAITRVLAPETGSPGRDFFLSIRGAEACNVAGCAVAGLQIIDELTLVIEIERPDFLFLHKLALPFASAVPPEVISSIGEDFALQPVGSGPFTLAERVEGQRLVFLPNPHYHGPIQRQLPGLVRFVGVSEDLAWMRYRAGLLDIAAVPPAEIPVIARDRELSSLLRVAETLRTQYVGLNCARWPFSDVRVRQAMNYAVDRHKLLAVLRNRASSARGIVPPTMPDYPHRPEPYPFDPKRAIDLLRAAGLGHGFSATLWLRNDDTAIRVAQSLQQDWAKVGIQVRLKPLAWGPFLDAVRHNPQIDLFLLGWEADFPDPSNFLDVLFHSRQIGINNHTAYSNPFVDRLLDEAASTADPVRRRELYHQAERQILEDAPWVVLYHPRTMVMVSKRLRGLRLHPWRPPRLAALWLDDGQPD